MPTPTLPLTYDEFRVVAVLLRAIDVRHLPSGLDFAGYLRRLLAARSPATAERVGELTASDLGLLRAEVAEYQAIAR